MGRALRYPSDIALRGPLLCRPKADSRRFAPFVAVLQASHPRKGYHASTRRRLWCDYPGFRRILLQAQVTTIFVVITDELSDHAVKLRSVEDDDFVEQLSA